MSHPEKKIDKRGDFLSLSNSLSPEFNPRPRCTNWFMLQRNSNKFLITDNLACRARIILVIWSNAEFNATQLIG